MPASESRLEHDCDVGRKRHEVEVRAEPDDEPAEPPCELRRIVPSGTSEVAGSSGSRPAVASSSSAASAGERAIGPGWSRDLASGQARAPLMRPYVGLSPTTPQNAAGTRIEPPVSLPRASGTSSIATTTADPPLEPPDTRSRIHGL